MSSPRPFDLAAYLSEKFPSLTLGGGLFYRWPVGIRFQLGPDVFRERAPKLYEVVFAPEDSCVIVSQDWPDHTALHQRYSRVFFLPGAFDSRYPLGLQSLEMTAGEHGGKRPSLCNGRKCQRGVFNTVQSLRALPVRITPKLHPCRVESTS